MDAHFKDTGIGIHPCYNCPFADASVKYSNWHYCTNPDNFREFTVIRTCSDFKKKEYRVKPPKWCPHKKELKKRKL